MALNGGEAIDSIVLIRSSLLMKVPDQCKTPTARDVLATWIIERGRGV